MDTLPQEAENMLGGEQKDFVVRSHRAYPLRAALPMLFFGLFWFGITSLIFFGMFGPLFTGQEISFGLPAVEQVDDESKESGGIVFQALFFGIFFLIGIGMLVYAGYLMFKGGSWYVGTPTRLFVYHKDDIKSLDWELFSGDVHVYGKPHNGTVTLRMRSGKVVRHKHGETIQPHEVHISGISQSHSVSQMCIQRIKENDPTPAHLIS